MRLKLLFPLFFILLLCLLLNFTGCPPSKPPSKPKFKASRNLCDTIITNVQGSLNAVSFKNPLRGVAVGDHGTIIISKNAGYNWSQVDTVTSANLYGSAAADTLTFIAVGGTGTILRSVDMGQSWSVIHSNNVLFLKSLRGTAFYTDNDGYAVGDSGVIFRTNDKGATWNIVHSDASQILNSVSYNSQEIPYVVGNNGIILYSTNGGTNWTQRASGTTKNLKSIHYALLTIPNVHKLHNHTDTGFIVGDAGTILKTTNNGNNWFFDSTIVTVSNLRGVFLTNLHWGYAVGENGAVLRYNGTKWTQLPQATSSNLNGVDPWWSLTAVCVGENGKPYIYNPPPVTNGTVVSPNTADCISWDLELYPIMTAQTQPERDITINFTNFEVCTNFDLVWNPSVLHGWVVNDQFYGRGSPWDQLIPGTQLPERYTWTIATLDPNAPIVGDRIISVYLMDGSNNPYLLSSYTICPPE